MKNSLKRLEILVGKDKIELAKSKHVTICGVGGVGSFVAEALARSGIGKLTLIDFDVIDESNLNRQLMSNKQNIGLSKVEVLKKRIEEISDCKVIPRNEFINEDTKIDECDYVIDCIDTLTSKYYLAYKCHELKIPEIAALGSAKRMTPDDIKITTLDKTRNDPLAKAFRNLVKKENYKAKIKVAYCDKAPLKTEETKVLGSSIFVPGSVGLYIASYVYQELIKGE